MLTILGSKNLLTLTDNQQYYGFHKANTISENYDESRGLDCLLDEVRINRNDK